MANYIKNEVLSEAYTHLDIDIFSDKAKLDQLRRELANFYQDRASFLFGSDVEIKVIFEEGSLRTRIVALGSAALMISTVVADYGSFRQGITQLANDAVSLAQAANLEVIFRTKTPYCDRIRVEKRKGVFGRVSALLTDLDAVIALVGSSKLPTSNSKLKEAEAVVDALLAWDTSVDTLFAKFDGPETEACVAEGLLEEVKKLPKQLPWQGELGQPSLRNQAAAADSKLSANVAALAAKYSAAVKAVEKSLKDRMSISTSKAKAGS